MTTTVAQMPMKRFGQCVRDICITKKMWFIFLCLAAMKSRNRKALYMYVAKPTRSGIIKPAQPRKAVSEMSYKISKDKVEKRFEYVKVDVLSLDKGKSIGEIFAEELDQMIADDIADVFKKYFPHMEIDYKKVLRLARAVIAEESKGSE